MIGKYDLLYYIHAGDIITLTTLANYKEGECVLDLGTGSAGCIVEVKKRVGSGLWALSAFKHPIAFIIMLCAPPPSACNTGLNYLVVKYEGTAKAYLRLVYGA